jgi:putative sigma-54 modulation protein
MEKQAIKVRAKWRDSKRVPRKENIPAEPAPQLAPVPVKMKAKALNKVVKNGAKARVHHVGESEERASMSLEEAIVEMGSDRNYLTFLDAKTGAVNVLVRRRDGHFDLVEA